MNIKDYKKKQPTTSVIVGYDCTNGKDNAVLVVGKREWNGSTTIINAFQGEEATELFEKLITPKKRATSKAAADEVENTEKEQTDELPEV